MAIAGITHLASFYQFKDVDFIVGVGLLTGTDVDRPPSALSVTSIYKSYLDMSSASIVVPFLT